MLDFAAKFGWMVPVCVFIIALDVILIVVAVIIATYFLAEPAACYINIVITLIFGGLMLHNSIAVPAWNHNNCKPGKKKGGTRAKKELT